MEGFRFKHPIEVRYGDLDPQGHLNNAKHFTYIEQARVNYIRHLDLWDGESFLDLGFILANAQITYRKPIRLGDPVLVGVRVTRLGNKSLTMEYAIENDETCELYASASTVQVAFDYHNKRTVPIPGDWRTMIIEYEGLI
ncbi:MAG: thioesterase family protein [Chloroflexota bacterium]|nr:thioesterase family protein [Chloroflexota bacterium]